MAFPERSGRTRRDHRRGNLLIAPRRHTPAPGATCVLTLAVGAIAALVGPTITGSPPAGTPAAASPIPGSRPQPVDDRPCPSIADIDPGFYPDIPADVVDPGFVPVPELPAGTISGEEIDPGFVAPFPPCSPADATPGP